MRRLLTFAALCSALAFGQATKMGPINVQASGTFTNLDCFYTSLSNVGGGTPCSIFHSSQGSGNYSADAVTGVLTVPVGSTTYQADAVAGLAVDNSGTTNTVALYGYAQCNVNNGKCWGANPAVQAAFGATGTTIQGVEVDVNIQTGATGATARGINVSMPTAHATPALSQGVSVNAGNSDGVKWDYGFVTQRASSTIGVLIDSLASTSSTASAPIILRGHDGSDVAKDVSIQASNVGNLNLTPASGLNVVITSGSLGFGSSNVPFVAGNGSGGLRFIATNSQAITFEHSGVKASIDATGKGAFNGGVQPASSGTAITWFQKATHATLDLASVNSGACTAATTETITGAALGDRCSVASGAATADGSFYACNVTATDTAKWQYCNLSGSPIDRASDTYTIQVIR